MFGTCGFGGDTLYYKKIFERTKQFINSTNEVIDGFYCQGKMPETVKDKYINMIHQNPDDKKLRISLDNFDKAMSHPNQDDLQQLINILKNLIIK